MRITQHLLETMSIVMITTTGPQPKGQRPETTEIGIGKIGGWDFDGIKWVKKNEEAPKNRLEFLLKTVKNNRSWVGESGNTRELQPKPQNPSVP